MSPTVKTTLTVVAVVLGVFVVAAVVLTVLGGAFWGFGPTSESTVTVG